MASAPCLPLGQSGKENKYGHRHNHDDEADPLLSRGEHRWIAGACSLSRRTTHSIERDRANDRPRRSDRQYDCCLDLQCHDATLRNPLETDARCLNVPFGAVLAIASPRSAAPTTQPNASVALVFASTPLELR
jgi:hypothetical protein